jgi:2-polyprenyl-3-methyl-5-hydroxy-6-metoxy-1,4-benzoquinol methylase
MSIGKLMRKILGVKLFSIISNYYRSIFVDLGKVAQFLSNEIPVNAHILDIGGGDGQVVNNLMAIRNDVTVTICDLSMNVGNSISKKFRSRVNLLPGTSIDQYIEMNLRKPDCIIISDVLHHIPLSDRTEFFKGLKELINKAKTLLLIKEVEPGGFISRLGYLSDRYISGDKKVSLISKVEIISTCEKIFGKITATETALFIENSPNYLLSIKIQ